MMNKVWPGSNWWKVDFHSHSPASVDYKGDSDLSYTGWLESHLNAGTDCVVLTDHNSGAWIDGLKEELARLRGEKPEIWSHFELFPGVELSCHGGVHLIAIFDPSKSSADIDALIGAVNYQGSRGDSDGVTSLSVEGVINEIHKKGGLAVPAHVDMAKGLFASIGDHNTLEAILKLPDALEVINPSSELVTQREEQISQLAQVLGSDSHRQADSGRGFTWVKMSLPSIEGLRLALLDPDSSIRRSDVQPDLPQSPPEQWIESISLQNMKLVRVNPLTLSFNPAYNSYIGGRGSGKSTVVESLRLSLGRGDELNNLMESPEIERNFNTFKQVYRPPSKEGMMLENTEISAVVNKGDGELQEKYRYRWTPSASDQEGLLGVDRLEEDGTWHSTSLSLEQARDNFPVKIFSQKQVLALANNPQALLEYIDNSILDQKQQWQDDFDIKKQKLLEERNKLQEYRNQLKARPALENEHKEARKKARVFSNDTFGELLKGYKRAKSQSDVVDNFYSSLETAIADLKASFDESILAGEIDVSSFEETTDAEKQIKQLLLSTASSVQGQYQSALKAITTMSEELTQSKKGVSESDWQKENDAHIVAYQKETQRLKEAGIESARAAADAVANEAALAKQIDALRKVEEQLSETEDAVAEAELELLNCREQLTTARQQFISTAFAQNDMLKVTLSSMSDSRGSVDKFREILRIPNNSQFTDIYEHEAELGGSPKGILWDMIDPAHGGSSVGERLLEIKQALEEGSKEILKTNLHGALLKRIKELPFEAFNELSYWFPEDEVKLEYRPSKGQSYRSISQASAGQKTAAILSFLMVHGNEPLILDQPEDDLDNALVSELVVDQLRENKKHRQLIIVTHNANVVVNADSELVTTMDFVSGQIVSNSSGGLQERSAREDICRIMEGGKAAFEKRYKRILQDIEIGDGASNGED